MELITDRTERLAPGAILTTDRGQLHVRSSRPHQRRFAVAFEEMASRSDAERWRGVVLRAEALEDNGEMWVHQLVGCRLVDQGGIDRGEIVALVANPASDLLELSTGALVPLRFVVDRSDDLVHAEVPEGLFD